MNQKENTKILVSATVNAPVSIVWDRWTNPLHIIHWNFASDDWQTSFAQNDLKLKGKFMSRMEAKDGSAGFDFEGEYTNIETTKCIEYILEDGRTVRVTFKPEGNKTVVTELFDPEQINSAELQKTGWQAILNNFKKYTESSDKFEILHFEITIKCNADKVYDSILEENNYKKWTSVFNPSSYFEGAWKKGSKILFIGTDSNGNTGGMVSKIKENIPGRFISIEHNGIIKDGKEVTSGPEADEWSGLLENYTFREINNKTVLSVDIDAIPEFKSYFMETWPKALEQIKLICENY